MLVISSAKAAEDVRSRAARAQSQDDFDLSVIVFMASAML